MDKNDVGVGFIPLEIGDTVQEGDQRCVDFCWIAVPRAKIGKTLARLHWPMRRKASVTLSPDSKAPEAVAVDPGLGYRLLAVGEAHEVGDAWYREGVWAPIDNKYIGLTYYGTSENPYRRKLPETPAQAMDAGIQATVQDLQAPAPALNGGVPDAWIPKPFTPNKYTRDLLSLDGRRVPVDVYSVSGAFALAPVIQNEEVLDALFHARKKILAPGQRGVKGVLQDLKEARQSLDRAIRVMEEG